MLRLPLVCDRKRDESVAETQTTPTRGRVRIGGIVVVAVLLVSAGVAAYVRHTYQKEANTVKLLRQAREAEEQRDLKAASTYYRLYLKRRPSDASALADYASVLNTRMVSQGAGTELVGDVLGTLRRLVRLEPGNVEALGRLATLYLQVGDYSLAEQHARGWLTQAPDSVDAALCLARARRALLRFDEAAAGLVDAIETTPEHPPLYALLIELLSTNLDRPQEAAAWVTKAVRRHPESYEVHLAASAFYKRQRSYSGADDAAEVHLERALALAPQNVDVLVPAVLTYIAQGRLSDAKELLDDAMDVAPESARLTAARAKWAVRTNDPKEMTALAEELTTGGDPSAPGGLDRLAQAAELFLRAGDSDAADRCIERLASPGAGGLHVSGPLRTRLDVLRGARLIAIGEPFAAMPFLERALVRAGPFSWAAELLAIAHMRTGAIETAVDIYEQILLSAPDEVAIAATLAWIEIELGRYQEARRHAQHVGDAGGAFRRQARLLLAACDLGEASRDADADLLAAAKVTLEALLEQEPEDATAIGLLAESFVGLGQTQRAVETVMESPVDDERKAALVLEVGRGLLDRELVEPAEALALEATRRFPTAAAGHELLVYVLATTDRVSEAAGHIAATELADRAKGRLWEIISRAQFASEQTQTATETLRRAVALQPTNVRARQALLRRTPDLSEARRLIDEIRAIEGSEGLVWRFERAWLSLERDRMAGRVEEAIELLKRCLTVRPGWIAARLLLGYANEVSGNLEEAADAYRNAIAQHPRLGKSQAAIRLVRVLRQLGDYFEADNLLASIADAIGNGERDPVAAGARRTRDVTSENRSDLLRLQTERHLRRHELESAAETAGQLLALRKDDPAWAALTVELWLRAGNLAEAQRIALATLEAHPDVPALLWAYARVLIRRDRAEEAESMVRAIAMRLERASHYLLLAQLLTRLEKHEEAERAIARAMELEPNNASVFSACAKFWGSRGDFAKQLALTRRAVELRGEDPGASLALARLLAASDASEHRLEAAVIVDHRLRGGAEDLPALLLRARLATTDVPPNTARAEAALMQALAIDPRSPDAHKLLAAVQIRSGRLNLARDTVSEGLAFAPKDPDLLLASAQIHCHHGDYHLAVTPLRWLLETKPRLPVAVRLLATAYQRTGQTDRAIRTIEGLAPQGVYTPTELIVLAKLYELEGDHERTDSLFHRAFEMHPSSVEVFQEHLQYHARLGNFDEVYGLTMSRRQKQPEDAASVLLAAELLATGAEDRRLREIGTTWFEEIATEFPGLAGDATYTDALCRYHRGELSAAERLFENAMRIAPTSPKPVNALAWLYSEDRNDPAKALELIEGFLADKPLTDADLLDTHGAVLLRLGRHREAARTLRTCLQTAGQTATLTAASYHLGLVLLETNEEDEARVYLRRALELDDRLGGLSEDEARHARDLMIRRPSRKLETGN